DRLDLISKRLGVLRVRILDREANGLGDHLLVVEKARGKDPVAEMANPRASVVTASETRSPVREHGMVATEWRRRRRHENQLVHALRMAERAGLRDEAAHRGA